MPKVSVIVTTYNRKEYLTETIQSILNQTYQDFELIVIDNFSNYDFYALIESFKNEKIIALQNQNNGIIAINRNIGINQAKGEYIAFCDDDDIWIQNKISKQMDVFDKDKSLVLCCTNRLIINSNGKRSEMKSLNWIPSKYNLSNLLLSNFVSYSSVLLKREILNKTGVFPNDLKFKAIEDYHLWLRIVYYGKIFFLNEMLVLYRIHDSNISTKLSKGAARNILLFTDLFNKYKFSISDKIKAYSIGYSKIFIYKLRGK